MRKKIKKEKKGKFRSLTLTLRVAFLSLSTLAILITAGLEIYINFQTQKDTVLANQEAISEDAAREVGGFIENKINKLLNTEYFGSLLSLPPAEQHSLLNKLLGSDPSFRSVLFLSPEGALLDQVSRFAHTSKMGDSEKAQMLSLSDQGTYFSPIHIDPLTSEPLILVSVPMEDIFGEKGGFLLAEVNLKFMWDIVSKIKIGEGGLAYVVDNQGSLLAFVDVSRVLRGETLNHLREVSNFVHGLSSKNRAAATRGIKGTWVISSHTILENLNWAVVVELPILEAYAPTIRVMKLTALALLIVIISTYLLSSAISERITKPLTNLVYAVSRFGKEKFHSRVKISSHDEIGALGSAFNNMAKRLETYTKNLQSERAKLVESLRRLNLATESAEIGVWEYDIINDALEWDDQLYRLYGIKKKDFGNTLGAWQQHLHPDDQKGWSKAMQLAIQGKKNLNCVFRIIWPNKVIRYIRAYGMVERGNARKPLKLVGVSFDITHEKEVDESKTEFVSLASHQLKTPVGAMNWDLEMLKNGDYGELKPKQKEVLDSIYMMNNRMYHLIKSFLNVSRIEMGSFVIEPVPTDVIKICDDALSQMKLSIERKKQKVVKKYPKKPIGLLADPKLLGIIVLNYISNAVKYTPEGGRIAISIQTKANNLIISVANNGEPIPEKDKEKIFNKLFRASNAQEMDPDGNGLGLYLVERIASRGGGKIWFESKKGKDTIFYVSFPLSGMKRRKGNKELIPA